MAGSMVYRLRVASAAVDQRNPLAVLPTSAQGAVAARRQRADLEFDGPLLDFHGLQLTTFD